MWNPVFIVDFVSFVGRSWDSCGFSKEASNLVVFESSAEFTLWRWEVLAGGG